MRIVHPAREKGKKIVVIVGGGFGGLNAAKELINDPDVQVILVDKSNHHLFQPLLYQVATAGLNPADIAVPIRAQFTEAKNVEVHWGEISSVDFADQVVKFSNSDKEIEYDYLVLACGSRHSYFGHPEWEQFAPGLKTVEQSLEIRRRILSAFEKAENEFDLEKQKAYLNFVIVGGGPTGVELAGAIADISKNVIKNDFRRIDPKQANIYLIEGGDRLLSSFSEKLSARAKKDLEYLGVEVWTKKRVENIDAEGVIVEGKRLFSKTVIWAAGVQATQMQLNPEVEKDRAGRIVTEKDLSLTSFQNVFVIGDMASIKTQDNKTVPGLAPAAIQEGKFVARMIKARMKNTQGLSFRYKDKGQMATIGKNKAIAEVGNFRLKGRLAWLAWLFIHILYLIGFKNRFMVLYEWTWSYFFSKRGARLITRRDWRFNRK